uniref:(California timema) hypothetical protein n=1 Tax=Timema californicum TaxID=61474 RepID=A0A7R9P7K5_TIMCA|nr:unnamed protein product [Timema californicum]
MVPSLLLPCKCKTTLSKKLSSKLNAKKMSTPPSCLLTLREKFDTHPIALRRAYYALGNYIAAAEIEYLCHHTPVVVDRFWHSTAAYTIASEVGESMVLPPEGDPIYNWPIDLLRPDMVVFLSVGEYNRVARHTGRNTTNTPEERTLQDNSTFRNKSYGPATPQEAASNQRAPWFPPVGYKRGVPAIITTVVEAIKQHGRSRRLHPQSKAGEAARHHQYCQHFVPAGRSRLQTSQWQELGNYKSVISKFFNNTQPPQRISLTNHENSLRRMCGDNMVVSSEKQDAGLKRVTCLAPSWARLCERCGTSTTSPSTDGICGRHPSYDISTI